MTKLVINFLVIVFLTILTQIGGVLYLISLSVGNRFKLTRAKLIGLFTAAYLVGTFLIVPLIAPLFGRTALPLRGNLRPLNIVTCLLNRHYVRPALKTQMLKLSDQMNAEFEGTKTNYLDANFPFFNGFPLFPHLSHNDGRKLDIAFYYVDSETGTRVNTAPSFIGYGIYDGPKGKEMNTARQCAEKGFWQYGFLGNMVPKWNNENYTVDKERTTRLVELLSNHSKTSKIFIEPHLKQRWGLSGYNKIRFHGCQAVRHDDHIHTQVK